MASGDRGRRTISRLGLWVALASLTPSIRADHWPQFRGNNASGVNSESATLPTRFSKNENMAWTREIGSGIACPIVWNDRVIVTGMTTDSTFSVFCLDAATGKVIWKTDVESPQLPVIMPQNSHASATPATDGERLYVYFSARGLLAFDLKDGSTVWEHQLPQPAYLMGWGPAVSPIVYEDLVLFNQDDDLSPYLIAVDKRTGTVQRRLEDRTCSRDTPFPFFARPMDERTSSLREPESSRELLTRRTAKEELWTTCQFPPAFDDDDPGRSRRYPCPVLTPRIVATPTGCSSRSS
ncbi:MAG: PQQ-binding-like beta-propeller repeat protein [Planctomycetota bacterium]